MQFKKDPRTGEIVGCFGVFDGEVAKIAYQCSFSGCCLACSSEQICTAAGHGGPNAADFVRQNLFDSLVKNQNFSTDVKTAFGRSLCYCAACT